MTSETKETYPEVTAVQAPTPVYTSAQPAQGGEYNKSMDAYQQHPIDQYQHTGVTNSGMASPPPQHNFQQQNSYGVQNPDLVHQGSYQLNAYQQQPGQTQPQMQQVNSSNNVPQQQQQAVQYQTAWPLASLTSNPAPVDCPACHKRVLTKTHYLAGNTTNAWGLCLFLTTCLCCLAWLVNGTKDVMHQCSNCGVELAQWHRSGRTEVKLIR